MKRIVIGYDGSSCSDAALEDLRNAGLPSNVEAVVVSVANVWIAPAVGPEPTYPAALSKALEQARTRAQNEVEKSRAMAASAGTRLQKMFPEWRVQWKAVAGSPAAELVKEPADLIVVGSHGRSAVGRLLLGSVAQRVAAEASSSVRIVRCPPQTRPGLRILLPVDGSEDSRAAVREVAARQWPASTEIRLVTVIDPHMETAIARPGVVPAEWIRANDERVYDWAGRMLGAFAGALAEQRLKVETDVFDGDPKEVLPREAAAWNAHAIVMGRRGLEHGQGVSMGSTASAIATRAPCSVEIVTNKRGPKSPGV